VSSLPRLAREPELGPPPDEASVAPPPPPPLTRPADDEEERDAVVVVDPLAVALFALSRPVVKPRSRVTSSTVPPTSWTDEILERRREKRGVKVSKKVNKVVNDA
jgi:hypothetical protein